MDIKTHDISKVYGAVGIYLNNRIKYKSSNLVVLEGYRHALYSLTGLALSGMPLLNKAGISYVSTPVTSILSNSDLPAVVLANMVWDAGTVSVFSGVATFSTGSVSGTVNNAWLFADGSIGRKLFSGMAIPALEVLGSDTLHVMWKLSDFPFSPGVFDPTFEPTFE